MKLVDIVLVAPVLDVSGIAESARNLYLAMTDLGARVKIIEITNWSHLKADLHPEILERIRHGLDRQDVQPTAIIHFYPYRPEIGMINIDGSVANFTYTVFETNKCPLLWRDILNKDKYLENWVPADFLVDSYINQGVIKNKVKSIPHGVDSYKYNPNVEPMEIEGKKKFTMMTGMDWSVRKNPELILTAFMLEFNNEPDACLVFKAYAGYADENSKNIMRGAISKIRLNTRSNATVLFIPDFLHSEAIPSFHRAADVWVNLSKGEGFDNGSLQSMSCGVPVVGSYSSAHKMYLNDKNGYPVRATETLIVDKEFLAKNPQFMDHSWWEVEINDARKVMRQAFNDWKSGKIKEKGSEARNTALLFPWQKTASRVLFETYKYFN